MGRLGVDCCRASGAAGLLIRAVVVCLRLSVGAAGSSHKPLACGSGSAPYGGAPRGGCARSVQRPVTCLVSQRTALGEGRRKQAMNSANITARLTRDPQLVDTKGEI